MSFADLPVGAHAEQVRDHWWWRPGWCVGRTFFTWHITFEGALELHGLVRKYQDALHGALQVDPVPLEWLHLTTQGVGFTDEVSAHDLRLITDGVRERLASLEAFTVELGPAIVADEAIVLPVQSPQSVVSIRERIREAIGAVWGEQNVPEPVSLFRPHVSVGYINRNGLSQDLVKTVESVTSAPAVAAVKQASLIELNRDRRMYEWKTVARAPLAA